MKIFSKLGICVPCCRLDDVDKVLLLKRKGTQKYFLPDTETSEISEKDFYDIMKEVQNRQGEPSTTLARVSNSLLPLMISMLSIHGFQIVRSGIVNMKVIFREESELRYYFCLFLEKLNSNITADEIIALSLQEAYSLKQEDFAFHEDHLALRFFLRNRRTFLPKQYETLA